MSAGTLTLANNSDAVTGNGTTFTTELAAGDFIVIKSGGVTYTLPVKSIAGNTTLTLARNYNGPAVTDAAWTAMPRDTLNSISAQIAADTAYIVRQRVLEVDNWYQLLEVNGTVTIVMADGSTYTGPSWLKLIDVMKEMQIDELMPFIEQVHSDAAKVATDREAVSSDLKSASKYAEAAESANSNAQSARAAAEKALAASEIEAEASQQSAEDAQAAKIAAEKAAASVQPDNLLQRVNNLADLADKLESRKNLGLENVAMKTDGVVPVTDGGTGGNTKTTAAVGLGTFVMNNANIQPTASSMDNFQGTLGTAGECYTVSATNTHSIGNWPMAAWSTTNKAYGWGALLVPRFATGSATNIQLYVGDEGSCNAYLRVRFGNAAYRSWCALLSDKNTTVDSNGFVKKASPIVKVYSDGVYETNVESEGATVVREGVGVYLIRGVMGMNADRAWGGNGGGIELPKDVNGQPRVWVDYDVDADGSIVIRTYHRTHPDAPAFARNLIGTKDDAGVFTETVQNGEPIDIPEDVFISVRVEMPANSAYNLSLLESRAEQQSSSEPDDEPVV